MTDLVEGQAGPGQRDRAADHGLRQRAMAVIPGGMYGHQNAGPLPAEFPQFIAAAGAARVWDVDGNEYVDLMCSYGPMVLGHRHPGWRRPRPRSRPSWPTARTAPGRVMVELAELLVATVEHADWAIFAKNGTDATTTCLTIARAATGRSKVSWPPPAPTTAPRPWCTPRPAGTTADDRANLAYYTFNDLASRASRRRRGRRRPGRGDRLARSATTPGSTRSWSTRPSPAACASCATDDRRGADPGRRAVRLPASPSAAAGSRSACEPDLSAWSKAIANGYALAAVLGNDRFREGAEHACSSPDRSGSRPSPMAAAHRHHRAALRDEDAIAHMERAGTALRDGILGPGRGATGLRVHQTGPVQMPYLTFADDADHRQASLFAGDAIQHGVLPAPAAQLVRVRRHDRR